MFIRQCPQCNKELTHTSKKNCDYARNHNTLCGSCSHKIQSTGKNNPMYGKSVYSIWLSKYGKEEADIRLEKTKEKQRQRKISDSTRAKISITSSGKNNNMYGKSVYSVWLSKYGKEKADEKLKNLKLKKSITSSGSNNPMYGRPSPIGSGNGWSGWYKDIYFRSLLELSYLKYLIDNDIKFENGELDKHKILYFDTHKNQEANYFPDYYLIETQEFVEIKPKKLLKTQNNIDKYLSAKQKFDNKFIIITEDDISKLTDLEIKELHDNGDLKFLDRYEEKYLKRIIKNERNNMHG